jgi:hypothetical protein
MMESRPNWQTCVSNTTKPEENTVMTRIPITRILLTALLTLSLAGIASAQATRTWVSGVGDDLNPCSRTAPCKTFAGAISKTAENGEIDVLDPGGYGALTITKAITINGEGTLGSVLVAGTNGFNVNVTTNPSTAVVYIHAIQFNGINSGIHGINYTAGSTLVVDHCHIYGFTGDGIHAAGTGALNLKVSETQIEHNGGDAIFIDTTAGQVLAMINRCYLQDGGSGIEAKNNVRAGVANTIITHQSDAGIKTTGNDSIINADDLFVTFCATGLRTNNAGTPSKMRVSDSIVAQNVTGLDHTAGTIDSFQGNSVFSNSTDGAFSSTTAKQ